MASMSIGLARARFAREDVEPWLEVDLEVVDDREMAHTQEAKHVETWNSHDIRPLTALRGRVTLAMFALFPAAP